MKVDATDDGAPTLHRLRWNWSRVITCGELQRFLTLDTVRGMLKSLPPCSLKPHGAGPLRFIEYTFIALEGEKKRKTGKRCFN